jgi:hypothetical protein
MNGERPSAAVCEVSWRTRGNYQLGVACRVIAPETLDRDEVPVPGFTRALPGVPLWIGASSLAPIVTSPAAASDWRHTKGGRGRGSPSDLTPSMIRDGERERRDLCLPLVGGIEQTVGPKRPVVGMTLCDLVYPGRLIGAGALDRAPFHAP